MLSLLQTKSVLRRRNRYLDIGTGYGGFLRAAHEMGFKETVGIELQPLLVELSNANVDGIQGAQVITGDFIKEDFSRLGSFDLITCNDVIEHVDDAALAIQKMCALLNEDGCLAFEVPNKDCIASVKADGHFLIFGITQLPKEKAARYYAAHTGAAEQVYNFEMGEMYELPWYIEQLEKNSLTAFIADTHCVGRIEEVPCFIADLEEAYKEWQELVKPALDIAVAEWITSSVEVYMKKLKSDFSDLSDEKTRAEFTNRYLRLFWTIIATKTS